MLCYGAGNLPSSGQYEVDITSLEPGPHLFIITFDDGYGKSLMKICPFSIGTGMCSSIEIIKVKHSRVRICLIAIRYQLAVVYDSEMRGEMFDKWQIWGGDGWQAIFLNKLNNR